MIMRKTADNTVIIINIPAANTIILLLLLLTGVSFIMLSGNMFSPMIKHAINTPRKITTNAL